MARRRSKRSTKKSNSKKNNSNNNRANRNEANFFHEQESKQKTSFDEIAEIFLGSNVEQKEGGAKSTESKAKASTAENNTSQASGNNEDQSKANSYDDKAYEEMKAKQQELLNNLKNLSEAVVAMTLIRDNVASLRIEILSNIYFTREVRPLIDAVNLIAFASSNMSIVAQNLNINASGDRKEVKDAFKLCYKMNDEIADILGVLTRRIKLYVAQLNNMDRNCPPFSFDEDSQV